ncbi:NADH-ubiquinone oxidoreductase-F iron-sulfur binding region domain-containing protein [Rhodococcus zopfii]|uniref:NADH-ubiquinone oxidoreductase-F iron-sulfur binding region domain-containing protein n=1 Tax=Rhodococcus zopfii TaxID=43772 RepID=UPI0011110B61|nr:NADH-ubiquinone oxidoreductase-F iron-sulfur binding region domain-containing protein [Rhodococcus zopfii]
MTVAVESVLYRASSAGGPSGVVGDTPARLVLPDTAAGAFGLERERAFGFFGSPVDPAAFLAELERSGLRGRGGAGYPAHRKFAAVAGAHGETVVVANGHEGEPASAKDRWLLTHRPHLVLDGLLLAAVVTGASEAIVYVSDADALASVEGAIAELAAAGLVPDGLALRTHRAEHTYVAGEESAVCRSINGFPAKPTSKPPRPYESGVRGLPTLISNVETLAHVAWIRRHGAAAFAEVGSGTSSGTALFTLTGAVERPGVYEMSLGKTIDHLIESAGGATAGIGGLMVGGWFGGLLAGDRSSLVCCYDAVREAGSGLGCAAVTVLGRNDDLVEVAGELSTWFQSESAMQCGVCVSGTNAIARAFRQMQRGDTSTVHQENLIRWGDTLTGRGACGFIDGAAALARTAGAELARRSERKES